MTKLKLIGSVFAASMFFAACGGDTMKDLESLKKEACACKDKACADAVSKKFEAKTKDMKEPSSEEDKKKAVELVFETMGCLAKHGADMK